MIIPLLIYKSLSCVEFLLTVKNKLLLHTQPAEEGGFFFASPLFFSIFTLCTEVFLGTFSLSSKTQDKRAWVGLEVVDAVACDDH